jgi:NADPH-dependent 2,4-dienoyl-CoA reductase/sulfur reductase-like enzyme/peroxiredoxin family protein/TusA-related sulfurtransferase/rhodanese-related sulfurtransferase
MKHVLIIGGVAGGASCAARLRRLDETANIVLLERGPYISYANCGLPYHVGGVIPARQALLLQTPEAMRRKYNIDVRTRHEALAIDRVAKTVRVRDLEAGTEYEEPYDVLVISTGSSPLRPPIPGIDDPRVRSLWTVPDADELRSLARTGKRAAVIGGGFIGLEIAESLRHAGLAVSLIEAMDQVMAPLDRELALLLHRELRENGVDLRLGDGVAAFEPNADSLCVRLKSGAAVEADFVVLSIGVRPNSQLARDCGLPLNARGGVVTDAHLRTEDPSIYAVGDVIEVENLVFGDRAMIALAGPANKQGRIAADNIAGFDETYPGTQGTSVVKVFALTAACTGANERTLRQRGLVRGRDYESVTIVQNHHAGYYPGARPMTLKLLFSMDGKKLYGGQIVGREGVDKRIDVIAAVQRMGGGVRELKELELAYAPPFSSAKDPVNMAGFCAENVLRGLAAFAEWDEPDKDPDAVLLDVREPAEVTAYAVPGAVNIPLGELRRRFSELDPTKKTIVVCGVGVRAHNGARILMQNGFADVRIYPGGVRLYEALHPKREEEEEVMENEPVKAVEPAPAPEAPASAPAEPAPMETVRVDCSGLQCPGPILEVFQRVKTMRPGDCLEITASDPGFARDIASWCRRTGNTLVSNGERDGSYVAVVRKGTGSGEAAAPKAASLPAAAPQGKTIIVFDGDLDKVLASFIIANGALAMGRPVTMFFTFWGLNALRKDQKQKIKKSPVESMFGAMLPRGAGKLKLSKMNMGGMGTAMMKKIMNDKNIDSLEDLIKKAMENGVKLVACSMSMDVMGIRKEELIDGVEIGGVGTYLGDAEESNVNLFI